MPLCFPRCTKCGNTTPIRRKAGHLKKRNHYKTMWCPWCKKVTRHLERF